MAIWLFLTAVASSRRLDSTPDSTAPGRHADTALMPADIKAILQLEVPLIVQIAVRTMTVEEVTSLVPGAIIELPKPADDELELLVNNKPIGTGTAVKVGENYGLRVTYIGDLQDRIAAMAADQTEAEVAE